MEHLIAWPIVSVVIVVLTGWFCLDESESFPRPMLGIAALWPLFVIKYIGLGIGISFLWLVNNLGGGIKDAGKLLAGKEVSWND